MHPILQFGTSRFLQAHAGEEASSLAYLAHRLAGIAQNHEEKKRRCLPPAVALAEKLGLSIAQPCLRTALYETVIREG